MNCKITQEAKKAPTFQVDNILKWQENRILQLETEIASIAKREVKNDKEIKQLGFELREKKMELVHVRRSYYMTRKRYNR